VPTKLVDKHIEKLAGWSPPHARSGGAAEHAHEHAPIETYGKISLGNPLPW
jgi:hypothetical protein